MRASWWHPVESIKHAHSNRQAYKRQQTVMRHRLQESGYENAIREYKSDQPFIFKRQGSGLPRLLPPSPHEPRKQVRLRDILE